MKAKSLFKIFLLISIFLGSIISLQAQVTILSGVKGGSYEHFARDLQRISIDPITVLNSNGSVQNFRQLTEQNNIDVTFLQQDVLVHQQLKDLENGTNYIENIRVLMLLAKEEIHLITRNDGVVNTLEDLEGKRVAVGNETQGTYVTASLIRNLTGVKWVEIKETLQFTKVLGDLSNNKIDAFFFVGAAPVSKLAKLPAQSDIKIVPLTDRRLSEIYVKTIIPKGTYKCANYDIETYAVKSIIATNVANETDIRKQNIRRLLLTIKRRIQTLKNEGHPKWKEIDFTLQDLDWELYPATEEIFNSEEANKAEILIYSGVEGGSYHQFAMDIKKVSPQVVVKTSKGSTDNLNKLITRKEVDATFLQYDVLISQKRKDEREGTNYTDDIRIIFPFADEQVHLITRKDTKIKSLRDLKKKNVAIGGLNSGTYVTARLIKDLTNMKWNDSPLPFDKLLSALENLEIDAFFFVGTAPINKFSDLPLDANLSLVSLDDKRLDEIYTKTTIPNGTYAWQTEDVLTYQMKSVLATNISDETEIKQQNIKTLVTDVRRKMDVLKAEGHPKWREIDFNFHGIDWPVYSSHIEILSGVEGGSYQQFANEIKRISIDSVTVATSNGSVDNFRQLRAKKDIDATFLQEDVLFNQVQEDLKNFTDYIKYIRVLIPLSSEEIHCIVRKDSGIDSLNQLAGKKVAMGSDEQGTHVTANLVKEKTEMQWVDVDETLELDKVVKSLVNGEIDAFFFTGAAPVSRLNGYNKDINIKLIPLTDWRLGEIYEKTIIPKETYVWQDSDVESFSVKSVLATNIADETVAHKSNVKKILREVKSKIKTLQESGHPKWKDISFNLEALDWEIYEGADEILNPKVNLSAQINILSGVKGGSYHTFASDIQRIATNPIEVSTSQGSIDNFKQLILRDKYYVSFLQQDVLIDQQRKDALDGTNYTENIRVVLPLAMEEIHLVARDGSDINDIRDLKGKRVAIGTINQGTYLTARLIKDVINVKWIDVPMPFDSAFTALYNNKIDAFFFVGTAPVSKLYKLPERANFKLLPIEHKKLEEIYTKTSIPVGTYKWEEDEVPTFSVKSVMATNITDETYDQNENIKQLLVDIKNGMLKLREHGHPKWKEIDFNLDNVNWKVYDDTRLIFK